MGEKTDDLGLGLSLKCPENYPPPAANTGPPFSFIHRRHLQSHQQFSLLMNHADLNVKRGCYGIDMNSTPANSTAVVTPECEEEAVVSSPNSTVSSFHGVSAGEEEEDGGDAATARKKLRLSKEQAVVLEETFKEHNTLNPKQKVALAKQLDLRPRQVEVWFQNRRARTKLKRTEVDCEYLKRCCETLTTENKRLQKEVNELRALKFSPQFYMNNHPPTTLTICPQCERVATPSPLAVSRGLISSGQPKRNDPFAPRPTMVPQHPQR